MDRMEGKPRDLLFTRIDNRVFLRLKELTQGYKLRPLCKEKGISYQTVSAIYYTGKGWVSKPVLIKLLDVCELDIPLTEFEWDTKSGWMKKGQWGRGGGQKMPIRGNTKLCKGPAHPPGGAYVSLKEFHFHKSGKRAGKPFSRCRNCSKADRIVSWNGNQGFVPVNSVKWVFDELFWHIGKSETARRLGMSENWSRLFGKPSMQKKTARKAMLLLSKVRESR